MAFFSSPAKPWLIQRLKRRNHLASSRSLGSEKVGHPLLGLPSDPARDIDEAIKEIKEEAEARRKRGASVNLATGKDLKLAVEDKLGRKL